MVILISLTGKILIRLKVVTQNSDAKNIWNVREKKETKIFTFFAVTSKQNKIETHWAPQNSLPEPTRNGRNTAIYQLQ